MRLGLLIALVLVIATSAPLETEAGGLQPCLAAFIRPNTRLEVELSTMKPAPGCPKAGQVERLNENALMLKATGKVKPTFGVVDPEGGEDSSGKAPGLVLLVLRFDRAVHDAKLLDLAKGEFGDGAVRDLPFDKQLPGSPALKARGYLVRDSESGRNLLCISAADDGTVTLAVICRTTTLEAESDQIGMLERMSQDDLGAIRF